MRHEIEKTMSVAELKRLLESHMDNDVVCVRQSEGTDFPPFICIESRLEYMEDEMDGTSPNQLMFY